MTTPCQDHYTLKPYGANGTMTCLHEYTGLPYEQMQRNLYLESIYPTLSIQPVPNYPGDGELASSPQPITVKASVLPSVNVFPGYLLLGVVGIFLLWKMKG